MTFRDPRPAKVYGIYKPPDITIRTACEDAGCDHWLRGWETVLDESTDRGTALARYIRRDSGRTFREMTGPDGLTVFRFEPGQRCFTEHRTVPETYTRHIGMPHRPTGEIYTHRRPLDWVDDFQTHTGKLREEWSRG